jgi:DNA-binding LacI/PurR family transcriptional regulator
MASKERLTVFPKRRLRHEEVADELRDMLAAGRWSLGDRLPAEQQLAAAYGVGINTMRRAVGMLEADGLLSRRHGSGTYVVALPGSTGSMRFIGAVLPSTMFYLPHLVKAAESAASAAGLRLVQAYSDYQPDVELVRARELVECGALGLLLAPSLVSAADPEKYLDDIDSLGVPYVFVERKLDRAISHVRTDWAAGGRMAADHLIALGAQRIGFIGVEGKSTSREVNPAFVAALADHGKPIIETAVDTRPDWAVEDVAGYAARCRGLELDAVFCMDDRLGAALLRELRLVGLRVPDDVAVIAYDDNVAEFAEVPLSTVSPPKAEVGRMGVEILLRNIENSQHRLAYHLEIEPEIIVRSSCGGDPPGKSRTIPQPML